MNSIVDIHKVVGYSVPTGFALLFLWSMYSLARNRDPHPWFWNILGVLQVIIGIQSVVGGVLFLDGRRTESWRHYLYGSLFPAIVLVVAHLRARGAPTAPWLVFGVAALVCFGLTFMALATGLGLI